MSLIIPLIFFGIGTWTGFGAFRYSYDRDAKFDKDWIKFLKTKYTDLERHHRLLHPGGNEECSSFLKFPTGWEVNTMYRERRPPPQ